MIFNLFKSNPTLKELIPKGFVDIHSHILPGIDDGANNINESIKLISEMRKIGFEKIITTPHTYMGLYDNNPKTIENSFKLLPKDLVEENSIKYASEYLLDFSIIDSINNKSILCLKDNHILFEMSYLNKPNNLYEIIHYILVNGYTPILAHPERYIYFHENFKEYKKLKKVGCKLQLNLLSVIGYYGKKILTISEKLLGNNLIDFVGSDIHNINHCNQFKNKVLIKNLKGMEKAIDSNKFFSWTKINFK